MLTSLAPSPIDNVTFYGYLFRIKFTMSAFYFGETLQARTTSAFIAMSTNYSLNANSFSRTEKEAPDIIIVC